MTRPLVLLAAQVVAVVGILGCLVVLATRHPVRLDLTPERQFTLSPHTREVLARISDDVRITVFYSSQQGAQRRAMADLLALYRDAAPRVTAALLDLDRSPGAAEELNVGAYNTGVVQAGARRERLDAVTEDDLTTALLKVAGTPPVVTYFVVGHGEHDPRDEEGRDGAAEAARSLMRDGFSIRVIEGAGAPPADAGLLVIAGPTRDLAPGEVEALGTWVEGGGRLLVLADPDAPAGVGKLLARFGLELSRDLVIDERARLFGTDGLSARVAFLNQTLVPDAPEANALLPVAQSVRVVETPGVQADYLALTGETSWADVGRRPPSADGRVFRPGHDRGGPIPVAAFARVPGLEGRDGRLAVIGDSDFVSNLHVNLVGNRDLLLATAGLIARADPLAAARPAMRPGGTFSPLTLTARQGQVVFWGAVVVPALLFSLVAVVLARGRLA